MENVGRNVRYMIELIAVRNSYEELYGIILS